MIHSLLTVIGLVLPTAITWIYFDLLSASAAVVQQVAYAVGKTIQFALPWWGWQLRKKESTAHVGDAAAAAEPLPGASPVRARGDGMPTRPDYRSSLIWGLLTGLAIAGAALALYHWVLQPSGWMAGPTEQARAKLRETGLNSLPVFLVVALFYSLCHSGLEEYYWRWFVFRHLTLRWNLTMAVLVSSLGFMAHHVLVLARYFGWGSPLTYGLALSVAVGGVIWSVLYRRFGTIAGPWLSHALVDAAIFAIAYEMGDWSNAG